MARQPTKQRLLDQGVRLFAKNGFRETTVGEIEAAAGLQPRRGALYRHYPSKEALLEAALEQHLRNLADSGADLDQLSGDIRDQALTLGRWLLGELDREKAIMRIVEQDGDRLPRLRKRFRETLVDPGYALTAQIARKWLGPTADGHDIDVLSAVALGAIINYRRSTWTFRMPPAGIDEERFLSGWADLCLLAVEALSERTKHHPRGRPPPQP